MLVAIVCLRRCDPSVCWCTSKVFGSRTRCRSTRNRLWLMWWCAHNAGSRRVVRVVAEHTAQTQRRRSSLPACAEYGLTAVLPMLTVRYEPSSLTSIEQTTQCRTLALNVVERLLRPVATLAPTTFVDVLWIVTGYVATPVTTLVTLHRFACCAPPQCNARTHCWPAARGAVGRRRWRAAGGAD
jgi:hypothetical protein